MKEKPTDLLGNKYGFSLKKGLLYGVSWERRVSFWTEISCLYYPNTASHAISLFGPGMEAVLMLP